MIMQLLSNDQSSVHEFKIVQKYYTHEKCVGQLSRLIIFIFTESFFILHTTIKPSKIGYDG